MLVRPHILVLSAYVDNIRFHLEEKYSNKYI